MVLFQSLQLYEQFGPVRPHICLVKFCQMHLFLTYLLAHSLTDKLTDWHTYLLTFSFLHASLMGVLTPKKLVIMYFETFEEAQFVGWLPFGHVMSLNFIEPLMIDFTPIYILRYSYSLSRLFPKCRSCFLPCVFVLYDIVCLDKTCLDFSMIGVWWIYRITHWKLNSHARLVNLAIPIWLVENPFTSVEGTHFFLKIVHFLCTSQDAEEKHTNTGTFKVSLNLYGRH